MGVNPLPPPQLNAKYSVRHRVKYVSKFFALNIGTLINFLTCIVQIKLSARGGDNRDRNCSFSFPSESQGSHDGSFLVCLKNCHNFLYKLIPVHQSLLSHKLVYNGGFSNFELTLLVRNSTYVAQILCAPSYKVWSTFTTKFGITELFILILNIYPPLYISCLVAML